MFKTLKNIAETGIRFTIAYALIAALFVMNTINIPYPLTSTVKAPLFLMGLYYWSVYRPTLLPVWLVFSFGLLMDIVSGMPFGLNALIFVTLQWLIRDQRKILTGQSFFVVWLGFTIVLACALLMQWGVFGVINGSWPSYRPLVIAFALSASLFPVIFLLLHSTHKILPVPHPLKMFTTGT